MGGIGVARELTSRDRSAPETFDQDKAVPVIFPVRSNVNGMAAGRNVPMAGRPDVTPPMPVPVTRDPNMMVRRTGDNDLMHRRRRWFGHEYLGGRGGFGGSSLPETGAERIAVVAHLPMRGDK